MTTIVAGLALGRACGAEEIKPAFVVSPAGNDANPGTLEKPFATLGRARDAVRESNKKMWADAGIT